MEQIQLEFESSHDELEIPSEPYILTFGHYKERRISLEQLIWDVGFVVKEKTSSHYSQRFISGYRYNAWLIEHHHDAELVRHAKAVKTLADRKVPTVKCQMCKYHLATYLLIGNNESGSTIGPDANRYLICERCRDSGDKIVTLGFSQIFDFPYKAGRTMYIQTLKRVFLGDEKARITKKLSFNFLWHDFQYLEV